MTQRTPEEIAREVVDALHCTPADGYDAVVAAALRSAVEAEREACIAAINAKEIQESECAYLHGPEYYHGLDYGADAIRARGEA